MARKITYSQAINEALAQEMGRDESVIVMGEDNAGGAGAPGEQDAWGGVLGVTKGLYGKFPGRVLDTPLSEGGFIGTAVGAAACGLRPVAELMFIDFMGVCFDQIFNQAAKFRYMFGGKAVTPVVIRTMYGAGLRAAAQHSQMLTSLFTHIPGLKVVCPATPYDAKGLMIEAIRDNDPVIFCEHKLLYTMEGDVPEESYSIPFGEANIVRDGDDVTIVTYGRMVHYALDAAQKLAKDGIEADVIDLRTTSPLDEETILESARRTGRVVVVDEANPRCSMATDIAALVGQKAFKSLKAPVGMVTAPHTPVPFAASLEDLYIPSADQIAEAVRAARS
ncbi:alpha-ketoacid dehydrogenase subunit beta [Paraburkholderia unamae]|uniref:Pyruvate dehydrogenase E1 component beta subunit n=1 Tax=Paraburkholderia unamae TaxID=219649 RepID=A0ABX5KAB8_9BURK|nr:alpha-ketoacid dehydrogenase subunit beta [Paraburkholderia unamae]PVX71775.1 pyruvate dehydrogenase E1 component beta subunit [Paraburkholderia unamae]CAG9275044.1 Acetoin:2,6-dichlorophenolindophenol oxidoreductase subunit beta [Paraburkholderia unamae]